MHLLMSGKSSRIASRILLALVATGAAVVFPPVPSEARAADVDICDLPGCGILEKGVDAGKDLFEGEVGLGVTAAKTYDLASDPLGYFAEKFAATSGQLIKELGGEVTK